jgi:regulator of protease activity HflC (stomatin/prohibitin superfamily)
MESLLDTLEFNCTGCNKAVRARVDQGGRAFLCPDCGATFKIPKVAVVGRTALQPAEAGTNLHRQSHEIQRPQAQMRKLPAWIKVPTSFGELSAYIAASWLVLSILLGIFSFFSTTMYWLSLLVFLVVTGSAVYQMYLLLRARQRVLAEKDIPLLWGFARLVAWDPVEGVLFLKNKAMGFYDDSLLDGHGGIRFIYPIFGDELALRVPLEVQTLQFFDQKVMTREYLSVTVHGTVKWRITDIQKFYLLLSRELRNTTDYMRPDGLGYTSPGEIAKPVADEEDAEVSVTKKLKLAIMWLRVLTEEQTRTVMSRISSGLLIADRLADEMPEIKAATNSDHSVITGSQGMAGSEWNGAADGLSRSIYDTLSKRVVPYGIEIAEVSLQEIRLPEEIVRSCIEAAQSAYLPLLTQRKAAAVAAMKRADLGTEVELLGRDVVGMREVVKVAPAFTLADFLSNFLSKGLNAQAAAGLAATAATIGGNGQLWNGGSPHGDIKPSPSAAP